MPLKRRHPDQNIKQLDRSAELWERFALLRRCSCSRYAPTVHQSFVGCNSAQEIGFGIELGCIPNSFSEGACSDPYFHMMNVFIAELAPQANFGSKYILFVLVVSDHLSDILIVEIQPGLVGSIHHPVVIPHPHVQVKRAELRNYHRVFRLWQSISPPMYSVSWLN